MKQGVTRRRVLESGLFGSVLSLPLTACQKTSRQHFQAASQSASGVFAYGIASGDPTPHRIILWTHVSPDMGPSQIQVIWEVALDSGFQQIQQTGIAQTSAARNFTVKVDVGALEAGHHYFYRFRVGDHISPVGQTRTLPLGHVDKLRFAVVSCANWQGGFFNGYDHIARQDHFDALIHLGDYIYEYGVEGFSAPQSERIGRLHVPRHEAVSLTDYRLRHRQYRSDPALQAVTAKLPLILVWDDHETSNDSWKGGAENHQKDLEGDWIERRDNALRAYYEWLPVREPKPGHLKEAFFRTYEFGDLLTLVMLETRLFARGEPIVIDDYLDDIRTHGVEAFNENILYDPDREMLGRTQLDFVITALKASKQAGKPWRLIANQVLLAHTYTPDLRPYISEETLVQVEKSWAAVRDFVSLSGYNLPLYTDTWGGYPVARERFFNHLKAEGIEDALVITGDAHEFWANELRTQKGEKMGIELCTSSLSSPTLAAFMGRSVIDYALLVTRHNKDVRFYDALYHGYLDLELTPCRSTVRMLALSTVFSRDYSTFELARFTVEPHKNSLDLHSPKGLNFKQLALFNGFG